jgi:hypothetical protein
MVTFLFRLTLISHPIPRDAIYFLMSTGIFVDFTASATSGVDSQSKAGVRQVRIGTGDM